MSQPPYPQQGHPAPGPYQYPAQPPGYRQPYQQQYGQQYGQTPQGHTPQPYGAPQGYQQPYQGQPQYQGQPRAYPQQAYQAQAAAQPYPGQASAYDPSLRCRVCGNGPAARVTFRGVVGAAIMHTTWTAAGPFCRDCGTHTFRKQTARTLAGGWCSVGAIVLTPIFLLMNVSARGKVVGLPAPRYTGQGPAPLDPGQPVFARPTSFLYPVAAFGFFMLIIIANLAG